MLILVLYIFGCSFTNIAGISVAFNSPLSQTQYVFDPSKVDLRWYYKVSGTLDKPEVYVFAKRPSNYQKILSLVGSRVISPYTGRITGWRNLSFALVSIKNLNPDDYTNYRITIEYNSLAENVEAITTLEKGVEPSKPIMTCERTEVSNITVKEGDDVDCSCSSTGLPLPEVVWKLPGIKSNGSRSVLKIQNISRNESNAYTCVASNQYGSQNVSVLQVKVQYPPSLPKITSTNTSSFLGQKVTFSCSAEADPAPKYFWKTPDNQNFSSTGNNTLVVMLRSSSQFGVYSCSASNVYGYNTSDVTLQQLFVPGKPHLILGNTGTFELSVKWSEPDSNGGSVILGYFIKISHGAQIIDKKETKQREYKKDKLQRNTNYTLCVWAKNIVGNGSESCLKTPTSNKGAPNVPSKPTLAFDGDHDTLTVTWDKVLGDTTYYIVEYNRDNKKWIRCCKLGTVKLECEINVVRGKIYHIRIIAGNRYGYEEGEVADIVIPTAKTRTTVLSSTKDTTTVQSTKEPAELGESSDSLPFSLIAISVLLVLLVLLAVIFLTLWLKRRSGHSRIQQAADNEVQHMAGPLGDLYAVVENKKITKTEKNEGKDLVYAELSQFNPEASDRIPEPHHTEYADISHILTQYDGDNDYEDIPPSTDEGAYASLNEVERSNSISI